MAGLTVLFSTFNGAVTLPRMLDAIERVEPPRGGWKIVAVDNGSTDGGADLLRRRAGRLPLTVLTEPRRGKNNGLNAGLASVEGDLVVFTDDDVVPRPDWLVRLRQVADEQRGYDIFGGAIEPIWLEQPPDWVLRAAPKGHFAWTECDDGPVDPRKVWGPNMAVRRGVLADHRFSEGIGPDGGAVYAIGLETEFVVRASRAGHRCWHAEQAVVGHLIRPGQLTEAWLLQRSYNHARGERRIRGTAGEDPSRAFLGYPRSLLRQYARALLGAATAGMFGDFEHRFAARRRLRELQGDFDERRLQLRDRRAPPTRISAETRSA